MTATTALAADSSPTTTQTIVDRFRRRVAEQPDRDALRHRVGDEWTSMTWGGYGTIVDEVAAGLIELGIERGDRVGLLSANRPEWHVADLAILSIGAVTVPVYPTSSSSQVRYVLEDSGARACFVDTGEQLAKVLLHREEMVDLERLIGSTSFPGFDRDSVLLDLDGIRALGRKQLDADPALVSKRAAGLVPGDLATLVYTSGTTGPPKGTMLTHGSIEWTIAAMDELVGLRPTDRFLSYLPLSHIAERVTSHFGQILSGGETWFAQSLVTVPDDLRACRPTIFFAVPRVWQKFHDAITAQVASTPRPVRAAMARYVAAGHGVVAADQEGTPVDRTQRLTHAALDRTLGARLRGQIGLDQARIMVSSAAPIHPDMVRWFHAIGLPIAEVWGQTEDCGPATVNPPDAIRIGSIGRPIPGLEVRVADDGELLVRGGSVCSGYWKQPEATAALIDDDGWMVTGDLGSIDDDGYVHITGRKKDLIINAAGKNIAPSEIESRLQMEPLIGQAVVLGDGRRYLVALLTVDADELANWRGSSRSFSDLGPWSVDPALLEEIGASVQRVNREHAPVEQIKYWRVLPEPLTVAGGELTPTLKVKRDVVADRQSELVEEMYAES